MSLTKHKIFLIEQDKFFRPIFGMILEHLGYDCRIYAGGSDPNPHFFTQNDLKQLVGEILCYQPILTIIDTHLGLHNYDLEGDDICRELRHIDYGKRIGIIGMCTNSICEPKWKYTGADMFQDKFHLFGKLYLSTRTKVDRPKIDDDHLDAVLKSVIKKYEEMK